MKPKVKSRIRLILDIILLILTISLFNQSLISMRYHEIAGLVVIGIMLVHIGINIKTVRAMCSKFTKIPSALKICLIVDIMLFLTFIWFGISGILCSKTILTNISSDNAIFKLYHMAAGAIAIVLLGIHTGLHIRRRPVKKTLAIILTVIFVAAGAYSAINSSFVRWASIPFTTISQQDQNRPQKAERPDNNDKGSSSHPSEGEQRKPSSDNTFTAQKLRDQAMYLSIILALSMITYWPALPKHSKRRCVPDNSKKI